MMTVIKQVETRNNYAGKITKDEEAARGGTMRKTIHEAIRLQSLFRQSDLMIHLTKDSVGPQLTESSLAAQMALAKILLEVEKIQRAEATEDYDSAAAHNKLRFAPASIVPVTQYWLEA